MKKIKSYLRWIISKVNADFANKNRYNPDTITAKVAAIRKAYAQCAEKESLTQEDINKQNVEYYKFYIFH